MSQEININELYQEIQDFLSNKKDILKSTVNSNESIQTLQELQGVFTKIFQLSINAFITFMMETEIISLFHSILSYPQTILIKNPLLYTINQVYLQFYPLLNDDTLNLEGYMHIETKQDLLNKRETFNELILKFYQFISYLCLQTIDPKYLENLKVFNSTIVLEAEQTDEEMNIACQMIHQLFTLERLSFGDEIQDWIEALQGTSYPIHLFASYKIHQLNRYRSASLRPLLQACLSIIFQEPYTLIHKSMHAWSYSNGIVQCINDYVLLFLRNLSLSTLLTFSSEDIVLLPNQINQYQFANSTNTNNNSTNNNNNNNNTSNTTIEHNTHAIKIRQFISDWILNYLIPMVISTSDPWEKLSLIKDLLAMINHDFLLTLRPKLSLILTKELTYLLHNYSSFSSEIQQQFSYGTLISFGLLILRFLPKSDKETLTLLPNLSTKDFDFLFDINNNNNSSSSTSLLSNSYQHSPIYQFAYFLFKYMMINITEDTILLTRLLSDWFLVIMNHMTSTHILEYPSHILSSGHVLEYLPSDPNNNNNNNSSSSHIIALSTHILQSTSNTFTQRPSMIQQRSSRNLNTSNLTNNNNSFDQSNHNSSATSLSSSFIPSLIRRDSKRISSAETSIHNNHNSAHLSSTSSPNISTKPFTPSEELFQYQTTLLKELIYQAYKEGIISIDNTHIASNICLQILCQMNTWILQDLFILCDGKFSLQHPLIQSTNGQQDFLSTSHGNTKNTSDGLDIKHQEINSLRKLLNKYCYDKQNSSSASSFAIPSKLQELYATSLHQETISCFQYYQYLVYCSSYEQLLVLQKQFPDFHQEIQQSSFSISLSILFQTMIEEDQYWLSELYLSFIEENLFYLHLFLPCFKGSSANSIALTIMPMIHTLYPLLLLNTSSNKPSSVVHDPFGVQLTENSTKPTVSLLEFLQNIPQLSREYQTYQTYFAFHMKQLYHYLYQEHTTINIQYNKTFAMHYLYFFYTSLPLLSSTTQQYFLLSAKSPEFRSNSSTATSSESLSWDESFYEYLLQAIHWIKTHLFVLNEKEISNFYENLMTTNSYMSKLGSTHMIEPCQQMYLMKETSTIDSIVTNNAMDRIHLHGQSMLSLQTMISDLLSWVMLVLMSPPSQSSSIASSMHDILIQQIISFWFDWQQMFIFQQIDQIWSLPSYNSIVSSTLLPINPQSYWSENMFPQETKQGFVRWKTCRSVLPMIEQTYLHCSQAFLTTIQQTNKNISLVKKHTLTNYIEYYLYQYSTSLMWTSDQFLMFQSQLMVSLSLLIPSDLLEVEPPHLPSKQEFSMFSSYSTIGQTTQKPQAKDTLLTEEFSLLDLSHGPHSTASTATSDLFSFSATSSTIPTTSSIQSANNSTKQTVTTHDLLNADHMNDTNSNKTTTTAINNLNSFANLFRFYASHQIYSFQELGSGLFSLNHPSNMPATPLSSGPLINDIDISSKSALGTPSTQAAKPLTLGTYHIPDYLGEIQDIYQAKHYSPWTFSPKTSLSSQSNVALSDLFVYPGDIAYQELTSTQDLITCLCGIQQYNLLTHEITLNLQLYNNSGMKITYGIVHLLLQNNDQWLLQANHANGALTSLYTKESLLANQYAYKTIEHLYSPQSSLGASTAATSSSTSSTFLLENLEIGGLIEHQFVIKLTSLSMNEMAKILPSINLALRIEFPDLMNEQFYQRTSNSYELSKYSSFCSYLPSQDAMVTPTNSTKTTSKMIQYHYLSSKHMHTLLPRDTKWNAILDTLSYHIPTYTFLQPYGYNTFTAMQRFKQSISPIANLSHAPMTAITRGKPGLTQLHMPYSVFMSQFRRLSSRFSTSIDVSGYIPIRCLTSTSLKLSNPSRIIEIIQQLLLQSIETALTSTGNRGLIYFSIDSLALAPSSLSSSTSNPSHNTFTKLFYQDTIDNTHILGWALQTFWGEEISIALTLDFPSLLRESQALFATSSEKQTKEEVEEEYGEIKISDDEEILFVKLGRLHIHCGENTILTSLLPDLPELVDRLSGGYFQAL